MVTLGVPVQLVASLLTELVFVILKKIMHEGKNYNFLYISFVLYLFWVFILFFRIFDVNQIQIFVSFSERKGNFHSTNACQRWRRSQKILWLFCQKWTLCFCCFKHGSPLFTLFGQSNSALFLEIPYPDSDDKRHQKHRDSDFGEKYIFSGLRVEVSIINTIVWFRSRVCSWWLTRYEN